MTVELRRVRDGEAAQLRELRLRALRESPAAFAATFEEGRAEPAGALDRLDVGRGGGGDAGDIVAVDGERWLGMVAGRLLAAPPGRAWLEALWVDPSVRRVGLGSGLIEAVAAWSRERGAAGLELSVTEGNERRRGAVRRAGFVETGRRRPLPADPSRTEVFLSRGI